MFMLLEDEVVPPKKVVSFDVPVGRGDARKSFMVDRIEGANETQDFTEFRLKGKRSSFLDVICLRGNPGSECFIMAKNSIDDSNEQYFILSKEIKGGDRIAGFPGMVKTVDEAEKLIRPILSGDLKTSKAYENLMDKL